MPDPDLMPRRIRAGLLADGLMRDSDAGLLVYHIAWGGMAAAYYTGLAPMWAGFALGWLLGLASAILARDEDDAG